MKLWRADSGFLRTLPIFNAFFVAALIIGIFDLQTSAIALILGVIAGGLVDMDHRTSGRIKTLLGVLLAFAFSALSAQLSIHHVVLLTGVLTVLGFGMTMLAALDARYRTIAFCTLIVSVYTLLAYNEDLAWYVNPLMIIAGTLIMQSSILLFYLIFPDHPVQQSLATTFINLADYARCKSRFFAPDEAAELSEAEYELAWRTGKVTDAFNATRDILFNRLAGQQLPERRRRQLNDFFIAQDLHERISAAHMDYRELLSQFTHTDILFRIERLITLQARVCQQYANAIEREEDYQIPAWLGRADSGLQRAWQHYISQNPNAEKQTEVDYVINNLAKMTQRLNSLGEMSSSKNTTLKSTAVQSWRDIPQRLRANLTPQSGYFRHAVRVTVLTFLSMTIAQLLHLQIGYWILLTGLFVCQPNRAATKTKVVQRIAGTITGVIVGSLLPYVAPDRVSLLSLIVISNTCFFYFRARRYSFSTFFITVQVFLGFALVGMNTGEVLFNRLFDTLLGVAIAWGCVHLIYPDQNYQSPHRAVQRALSDNAAYLSIIVEQLQHGNKDDIAYRSIRRRVHESASALAAMADELNQASAKKLVQLNYRIVSQLSALAVHRGEMTESEQLQDCKQIADTLQKQMQDGQTKTALPAPEDAANSLQQNLINIATLSAKMRTVCDELEATE